MALPSSLVAFLEHLDQEPGLLVAWAAFHPIALAFVLGIPLWLLSKIGLRLPSRDFGMFGTGVAFVFGAGWLLGFFTQILMTFMGIPGLKMLAIYLSMYLCLAGFFVFNAAALTKKFRALPSG